MASIVISNARDENAVAVIFAASGRKVDISNQAAVLNFIDNTLPSGVVSPSTRNFIASLNTNDYLELVVHTQTIEKLFETVLRLLPRNFIFGIQEITPRGNIFSKNEDLIDFLRIFLPTIQASTDDIASLSDLGDPDTVPDNLLDNLGYLIGYIFDPLRSVDDQRKTIKSLVEIYKRKATIPSIKRLIRVLTPTTTEDSTATIFEPFRVIFRYSKSDLSGSRLDPSQGVLKSGTGKPGTADVDAVFAAFPLLAPTLSTTLGATIKNTVIPEIAGSIEFSVDVTSRDALLSWLTVQSPLADESGSLLDDIVEDLQELSSTAYLDVANATIFASRVFLSSVGSFDDTEDVRRTLRLPTTGDAYIIAGASPDGSAAFVPSARLSGSASISYDVEAIVPTLHHIQSWDYYWHGVYEIQASIPAETYRALLYRDLHPAGTRVVFLSLIEILIDHTAGVDPPVLEPTIEINQLIRLRQGLPLIHSGPPYAPSLIDGAGDPGHGDSFSGTALLSGRQSIFGFEVTIEPYAGAPIVEAFRRMWFSPLFTFEDLMILIPSTGTGYTLQEVRELDDRFDEQQPWDVTQDSGRLLEDQFTTNESAPIATPRTMQPGPGTMDITDVGNNISITNQELTFATGNGTAADTHILTIDVDRDIGTAFHFNYAHATSLGDLVFGLGPSISHIETYGIQVSADTLGIFGTNITIGDLSPASDGITEFFLIARSDGLGALILGKNSGTFPGPSTKLLWVFDDQVSYSTVRFGLANEDHPDVTIDDLRVKRLSILSNWTQDYGIATVQEDSPSSGYSATGDEDGIIEFTWTPAASEILELSFRRISDTSRWFVRADQAGSTIELVEEDSGETIRDTAARTWTVSVAVRIVVVFDGTDIRVHSGTAGSMSQDLEYTSATFNQTETGIKVSGFTTASNLRAWPRTISAVDENELTLL